MRLLLKGVNVTAGDWTALILTSFGVILAVVTLRANVGPSMRGWLTKATIAVIALAIGVGVGNNLIPSAPTAAVDGPPPATNIASPLLTVDAPRGKVERVVQTSGKVANLSQGETVWVLTTKVGEVNLYLQPGPCVIDNGEGRWHCSESYVGSVTEASGTKCEIIAVRANSERTAEFVQRMRDIERAQMPDGSNTQSGRRVFPANDLPDGVVATTEPLVVARA